MSVPTLVSYGDTAFNTTTSPKTVAITWNAGDIIIYLAGCQNNGTLSTPTVAGLTFTQVVKTATASTCSAAIYMAKAEAAGSGSVSGTFGNASDWGFGVWVWRNAYGVGGSAEQHTTTSTVSMGSREPNSAICYGIFDVSAAAVLTITPTPTTTRERTQIIGTYTYYIADLFPQPTNNVVVPYGLTSGSGVVSIVVAEVIGFHASSTAVPIRPRQFAPGLAR